MTFPPSTLSSLQLDLLPASIQRDQEAEYALARDGAGGLRLVIAAPAGSQLLLAFEGECSESMGQKVLNGVLNAHNAAALRSRFEWLRPRLLGLATSFGMGDRLGLATPGHIQALRAAGGGIAPIFAQQSMREMDRTRRTPQQVMDDATWGIFSEGWTQGAGADADHLKTTEDLDACLSVGFTFFTIDPGAFVDNRAVQAGPGELDEMAARLPAEVTPGNTGLSGKNFDIEGLKVTFDESTLLRAAVKYGRAVAHVADMYRHLEQKAGAQPFELEVSVDETEQPTTHAEHIYITSELKRLGVKWVSLAPRFVGRFEKGVDYIGDLQAFEQDAAGHAAIARQMGPYKLSIHSGSDKFSIYPIVMKVTRGLVHVKTAGTSYLEALRTAAVLDPELFREIYVFARERYMTDRASYHVSAELSRAPLPEEVTAWPALLNQFDAREILHVTFGSVLTREAPAGGTSFHERLLSLLSQYPQAYAGHLQRHFIRHLQPFTKEV